MTGLWCTTESLEQRVGYSNHFKASAYFWSYSSACLILFSVCSAMAYLFSLKHPKVSLYFIPAVREKTACEQHKETAQAVTSSNVFRPRPSVGQYIPTCDHRGNYEPMQCHASTGQCWCVYPDGQEIAGTRTGPGSRPPCKHRLKKKKNTNRALSWELLCISSVYFAM